MTEIKFGRVWRNGKLVGYCSYVDEKGHCVEIFSPPYEPLEVYVAGEKVKPTLEHIMVWTMVAGFLGQNQLLRELEVEK